VPFQKGIELAIEKTHLLINFNDNLNINLIEHNGILLPVNGEKTKGETICAIEHMPEMQP